MTPELAQLISDVGAKIPTLAKTTRNGDAGFNYVSIDGYYEKVAPILREAGLIWVIDEEGFELIPNVYGEHWCRFEYMMTLFHTIGLDTDDGIETPSFSLRLSLIHPFQGAQTTGSAMSYAEKIFLRTLFKIVTGEPDADAFARGKGKRAAVKAYTQTVMQQAAEEGDEFTEATPVADPETPVEQVEPKEEPAPKKMKQRVAYRTPPAEVEVPTYPPSDDEPSDDEGLPPESERPNFKLKATQLITAVNAAEDLPALKAWRLNKTNGLIIADLKDNAGEEFARVQAAYSKKLAELKEKD